MKNEETQVVVEKKRKEKFELLPTLLPDVQLKSKPEKGLELPSRAFELFYGLSQKFAKKDRKIKQLEKEQKEPREEIIKMAKANDGLRGIISERDNFSLTVFPSETTSWDREMLKESMGLVYPMAVTETFTINISVPLMIIPEKKRAPIKKKTIERAIVKALSNLGIPKKDLTKMIRAEIKIAVNEKKLKELITLGQVKLLPKTKKSEVTWKVRADPLRP